MRATLRMPPVPQQHDPIRSSLGRADEELVARCRQGDASAWRELVQHYRRLVHSVPRRAGLDEETCDDVFQEVFAILHTKLASIERDSALPKWIATTARRVTLRAIERRARDRKRRGQGLEAVSELEDATRPGSLATPDEAVARWETQERVREALESLGQRCQSLLETLVAAGDRPDYGLIAERLGMPTGSIGPTRARCLAKLLDQLRARDLGPEGGLSASAVSG